MPLSLDKHGGRPLDAPSPLERSPIACDPLCFFGLSPGRARIGRLLVVGLALLLSGLLINQAQALLERWRSGQPVALDLLSYDQIMFRATHIAAILASALGLAKLRGGEGLPWGVAIPVSAVFYALLDLTQFTLVAGLLYGWQLPTFGGSLLFDAGWWIALMVSLRLLSGRISSGFKLTFFAFCATGLASRVLVGLMGYPSPELWLDVLMIALDAGLIALICGWAPLSDTPRTPSPR